MIARRSLTSLPLFGPAGLLEPFRPKLRLYREAFVTFNGVPLVEQASVSFTRFSSRAHGMSRPR